MRKILILLVLTAILNTKYVFAVSTPTPSPILTTTPVSSPSSVLEENVAEVRNALKEAVKNKINEIKDKIEKKSYVGNILEITDSAIVITNFRGKQRIRILEDSTIINALKREIKANALEVEDKIIAIGDIAENEVLEAKRIVVVEKPKTVPLKRRVILGNIEAIDSKFTNITIKDTTNSTVFLLTKDTKIYFFNDQTKKLKSNELKLNQKVLLIYFENTSGKTSQIKTVFVIE
jgi:hypothetical protein